MAMVTGKSISDGSGYQEVDHWTASLFKPAFSLEYCLLADAAPLRKDEDDSAAAETTTTSAADAYISTTRPSRPSPAVTALTSKALQTRTLTRADAAAAAATTATRRRAQGGGAEVTEEKRNKDSSSSSGGGGGGVYASSSIVVSSLSSSCSSYSSSCYCSDVAKEEEEYYDNNNNNNNNNNKILDPVRNDRLVRTFKNSAATASATATTSSASATRRGNRGSAATVLTKKEKTSSSSLLSSPHHPILQHYRENKATRKRILALERERYVLSEECADHSRQHERDAEMRTRLIEEAAEARGRAAHAESLVRNLQTRLEQARAHVLRLQCSVEDLERGMVERDRELQALEDVHSAAVRELAATSGSLGAARTVLGHQGTSAEFAFRRLEVSHRKEIIRLRDQLEAKDQLLQRERQERSSEQEQLRQFRMHFLAMER